MSYTLEENYKMGILNEKKVNIILNDIFDTTFIKTGGRYDRYDFEDIDNKYIIELKSRRNKMNEYKTTFLNYNKYLKLKKIKKETKKKIYLFFLFTDGLYYIRLKKTFKKFNIKTIYTKQKGIEKNLEIDINLLKKIDL